MTLDAIEIFLVSVNEEKNGSTFRKRYVLRHVTIIHFPNIPRNRYSTYVRGFVLDMTVPHSVVFVSALSDDASRPRILVGVSFLVYVQIRVNWILLSRTRRSQGTRNLMQLTRWSIPQHSSRKSRKRGRRATGYDPNVCAVLRGSILFDRHVRARSWTLRYHRRVCLNTPTRYTRRLHPTYHHDRS